MPLSRQPLLLALAFALIFGRSLFAKPAAGFRQLEGKHITLITDLPADPQVDELPKVFDSAFKPWCEYFGVDPEEYADWHVTGYLMQSKERFQAAGYWRKDLPPFPNGFSTGEQFWVNDQSSPYYRRHLFLHEGVHSFMYMLVSRACPPWYTEGIAELLATHRWQDGKLQVGYLPKSESEVPQLGRIEMVQNDVAQDHPLNLPEVLAYNAQAHQRNEAYAWSWALAAFLDGSPRYRDRFRQLPALIRQNQFGTGFRRLFADDSQTMNDEWQSYRANIDYGYDFPRMAIDFHRGEPLTDENRQVKIAADRGWQSSGIRLEAGKQYELRAKGRYQVGKTSKVWWCEPGGVTLRYYHGQPLGILLAAIVPDGAQAGGDAPASLAKPIVVGLGITVNPTQSGTLYLRVNDSPADLGDNAGSVKLKVVETGTDR